MTTWINLTFTLIFVCVNLKTLFCSECPPGCVCTRSKVSCYQVREFNWTFPLDTTHIFFDELNTGEIPSGAFANLHHLTRIEMMRTNVGVIQSCAFKDIPSLKKLDVRLSVFGAINKMAFWNTSDDLIINFNNSKITEIHSYAFMNLQYLKSWVMHNVQVDRVHQNAFYNIEHIISSFIWEDSIIKELGFNAFKNIKQIERVLLRRNNFTTISCGSISDLLASSAVIDVTGNVFNCNCKLTWLIQSSNARDQDLVDQSVCNSPEPGTPKRLREISTKELICSAESMKPTSCNQPEMTTSDFTCPGRTFLTRKTENKNRPSNMSENLRQNTTLIVGFVLLVMFFSNI